MNTVSYGLQLPTQPTGASIRNTIAKEIDDLVVSLPEPNKLSADQRRGIISRYTAVLEGNFIYWMTAAYAVSQVERGAPDSS